MLLVLKIKDGVESGIDPSRSFSMRRKGTEVIIDYTDTNEVQKFKFYDKEQAINVINEVAMVLRVIDPTSEIKAIE